MHFFVTKLFYQEVEIILMAKVSPGPSIQFDYKNENPAIENHTSSTNNNWLLPGFQLLRDTFAGKNLREIWRRDQDSEK